MDILECFNDAAAAHPDVRAGGFACCERCPPQDDPVEVRDFVLGFALLNVRRPSDMTAGDAAQYATRLFRNILPPDAKVKRGGIILAAYFFNYHVFRSDGEDAWLEIPKGAWLEMDANANH